MRKFLGIMSFILAVFSAIGIVFVFYAEKNPEKSFLKPLPYVEKSEEANESPSGETPTKINETPAPSTPGTSGINGNKPSPTSPSATGQASSNNEKYTRKHSELLLNVPLIYQNPKYPTGCEPVAATMVLNYFGYGITDDEFVNKMPHGDYPYTGKDGKRYGPDPDKVFVGDPRDPGAWGIYAPGLKKVIDIFLGSSHFSVNITGCSVDELYRQLDRGNPVIVWGTIGMGKAFNGISWYVEGDNKLLTWVRREHCLVLIGYNKNGDLIFNDPLDGKVTYKASDFMKSFNSLGKQALYVKRIEK